MTTRQQRRLELAEQVCRLVMRHQSCGLVEEEGYRPDLVVALHLMQREAEKAGNLNNGSLHWLGEHADAIQQVLFAWMEEVGIDPCSRDKAETKLMAMNMVRDAFGPGYEGEIEQLPKAKRRWVEKTADDRAAAVAQEIASGKLRIFDEMRIAIAAEILEAEHVARDPFVEAVAEILSVGKKSKETGETPTDEDLNKVWRKLFLVAGRWIEPVMAEKE